MLLVLEGLVFNINSEKADNGVPPVYQQILVFSLVLKMWVINLFNLLL